MSRTRSRREMDSRLRGVDRERFLREAGDVPELDPEETALVIDELVRVLDGIYVHLPLKRAMYGIDPIQQLRRLKDRTSSESMDAETFHAEVARILSDLRDAHTIYLGPAAKDGVVARLPLLVEQFGSEADPGFLVSKTIPDLIDDEHFVPGVELVYWNGMPIADAVRRHGENERGGRPDSALARAVDSLTFRPLGYVPIPSEHWVVLGYRPADSDSGPEGDTGSGPDGDTGLREVRLRWRFIRPDDGPGAARPTEAAATASAIHPDRSVIRRAKKLSFNPGLWRTEQADRVDRNLPSEARGEDWIAGRFQDNVSAKVVTVDGASLGYLRLWSFDLVDDDGFVDEVVDLLALLPQDGLIVDLRGNPGGLIWAAERLLQLFCPHPIEPTLFSLLATDMTRTMSDAPQNRRSLSPWRRSLDDAAGTGEIYSQGVPITPVDRCNDRGQVYGGPVVAVVDATTYSAGDLFAAGFADNNIGTMVSVGKATGAGGANVWRSDILRAVLSGTGQDLPQLPGGAGFTISVRRATRIGASEGSPIEDVGIAGHRDYAMTRNDLLNGNRDLLSLCGLLIDAEPATTMDVAVDGALVTVSTENINRIDMYTDGRPFASFETDGTAVVELGGTPEEVRVEGYRGDVLAQTRRVHDRDGTLG